VKEVVFFVTNLGIVLYELFHKKPPYMTRETSDPKMLIERTPLTFRYDLDRRISDLITSMLKIQPFDRPSCKEILMSKDLRDLAKENSIDLLDSNPIKITRNQ
jgi:serine/threonine protein kinase